MPHRQNSYCYVNESEKKNNYRKKTSKDQIYFEHYNRIYLTQLKQSFKHSTLTKNMSYALLLMVSLFKVSDISDA